MPGLRSAQRHVAPGVALGVEATGNPGPARTSRYGAGITKSAEQAREALLAAFEWRSGHADIWRAFTDGPTFAALVSGVVEPWRQHAVSKVIGIESRGFLLGGAAAVALEAGFVAVRKAEGILPGPKRIVEADEDYHGRGHRLRMQDVLQPIDRVLLVDDWAERGSQARAARRLVEDGGATFLGLSLLVDQLTDDVRTQLGRVTALVTADELGPAS